MSDQATPIQALRQRKPEGSNHIAAANDGAAEFAKNPGPGSDQATPLKALKPQGQGQGPSLIPQGPEVPLGPPLPVMGGVDPRNLQVPVNVPVPSGISQGQSVAERAGPFARKEFFGLQEADWKSTLLVFALVLIFSSSMFFGLLRPYAPSLAGHDGRATILGSVVAAIVASLIFLLVKFAAKF
jgi:hypothetical protein